MDRPRDWSGHQTYSARFEDGPRDATVTTVLSLETGEPPELLLTPGRADGVYVLAGAPGPDGSLPYWWMPRKKVAALQRHAARRTAQSAR